MFLRKLELNDAPFMLEWMHDDNIVKDLFTDFSSKSLSDCVYFIEHSVKDDLLNLAIANDDNEYMGTVSLRHISTRTKTAEFAIAVRKKAMSRGFAWFGMSQIFKYAFESLNLDKIFWCVSKDNKRAIKFYEKHSFSQTPYIPKRILCPYSNIHNLLWFCFSNEEYLKEKERKEILGCKIISIKTIESQQSGSLSFFEANHSFDFDIKRFYYISGVPEGCSRGFHAHKQLKQLLFCPYGRINLILDNGKAREEIVLDDPSVGVIIERPIWREMVWLQKNSVLCVAASEYYNENDYIRDYEDYLRAIKKE